jgi:hypothetical protein
LVFSTYFFVDVQRNFAATAHHDLAPDGPRFTAAGRPRKDHHVELSKSRP